MSGALPPGQRERDDFPRFGATPFATRFPAQTERIQLHISGDVREPVTLAQQWAHLPHTELCADFHCVTTWSRRSLVWGGVRFADFYRELVVPLAGVEPDAQFVVLRAQDGYRASLPLADLMADTVLLADTLDGEPLTIAHGAPLRLVAPAHYGYKSVKHLDRIEFRRSIEGFRPVGPRFMAHERARVAFEERGRGFPGWLLRWLYRPLIQPTARQFARAMEARAQEEGRS
jgi:DMSO/TMAO reductase YedYZ molybdopterin-dependent catalytic subunit